MLRVVAHNSAAAAQAYYTEGLKREDYYSQGQEIIGQWYGRGADRLGLVGDVTSKSFQAVVDGRHPVTGEKLTPRHDAKRTVGYDINFHAVKSLSVLHALTGDERLVDAFRNAVAETMVELEGEAATRVRLKGANDDRVTGNLIWAEFVHFTARPVGGIPDPHLHVHCYAANLTFDEVEDRWKAAKFRDIKKNTPYYEAVFHSLLSGKLADMGYEVRRTRGGWEIAGIPQSAIDKFSRRTAQIERLAAARGIDDVEAKAALGATTREGKRKGLTQDQLLQAWNARLTEEERTAIQAVHAAGAGRRAGRVVTPAQAFDHAHEKLFAKDSVVGQKRLIAETLRFGVGQVSPEMAWHEFEKRGMIVRKLEGEWLCTSADILAEEISLINFVRSGRGQYAPLKDGPYSNPGLSGEQNEVARHILGSKDQVIAVRGAAGAGKTTTMKEVVAAIESAGAKVFAFAPSASASRDTLRKEGLTDANTVAHLLFNTRLQEEMRGQVIWLDEAGLVGTREMWEVMRIAGEKNCRVILTGDAEQHSPVPHGDAFRLLQKYAGLPVAELTEIRRQEVEGYKLAVAALSKGDIRGGFEQLDKLGAIVEIHEEGDRYRQLAQDYLHLSRKDTPPLVVSPTHAEGEKVTSAIREALAADGKLGKERALVRYHSLQWEEADRRHPENYGAGLVVQFNQNARGFTRGEFLRVTGHNDKGEVTLERLNGKKALLPLEHAGRFQVFEERPIPVAKGERIRITHNGSSADGKRLNNGDNFTIEGFNRKGQMLLNNGALLNRDHGHFTHGYCQTSHSSQSKTVRHVLVAQSSASFLASSANQYYVSVSRGKQSVRIYTDDRVGLQEAVGNSSRRTAGIELLEPTEKELSRLMSKDDGKGKDKGKEGKQWRDIVKSRKAVGGHVANLMKARRMDPNKPPELMDWRKFGEMRKKIAGADGRSRSKGQPSVKGKKADTKHHYRAGLRGTFHRVPPPAPGERENVAKETKKSRIANPAKNLRNRLQKSFKAAKQRFKTNVANRVGRAKKALTSLKSVLKPVGTKRAADNASKQQTAKKAKTPAKQQAKVPQAPPPVMKK
ncbi:MAG: MobF family relaxase [Chthoniobacteraceae bacterium]